MRCVAYGLPPGPILHRQDTVSENQGKKRRDEIDPETGREIPRGSDEESDAERSSVERDEPAKQSTSPHRPSDDRRHSE